MSFMNAIDDQLSGNTSWNRSRTENGAIGLATSGKSLVDLNFKAASLRHATSEIIEYEFVKAFYEDKMHAMKWLFFARDVREGLGERRLFREVMKRLGNTQPEIADNVVELIAEYGRWDDLFSLVGSRVDDKVIAVLRKQLDTDFKNMKTGKPVSLLAKWMPSENTSSFETRQNAKYIREKFGWSPRYYRKRLTALRSYIDIVESKMSSGRWGEINYEAVPSKANLLYKNAFARHDEERRNEYLEKLQNGEVKINASVAFPHDIVHKYTAPMRNYRVRDEVDITLEEMWKALPDLVNGEDNTLFIRDGSASMYTNYADPNSRITALDVATALAIYFSERCGGGFKDKFITFSSRPKMISLKGCKNLREKLERCYQETDCSSTDIEKTFDLILDTAIRNNMSQEEMPKNIVIVSDMQFDGAHSHYGYGTYGMKTLFDEIADRFKEHGYKLPRLVFWKVNSLNSTIPVTENECGVALVSGFSVNVCKMVLSGNLDPYGVLIEQLDSERYQAIEDAIKDVI